MSTGISIILYSVILHELPEGVTTFSLLVNIIKRKTALYLSLAVGLATPIGALVSLTFIGSLGEPTVGMLLAMAGGSFLYIGASDPIPETHEEKGLITAGSLFLGVICLYSISKITEGQILCLRKRRTILL